MWRSNVSLPYSSRSLRNCYSLHFSRLPKQCINLEGFFFHSFYFPNFIASTSLIFFSKISSLKYQLLCTKHYHLHIDILFSLCLSSQNRTDRSRRTNMFLLCLVTNELNWTSLASWIMDSAGHGDELRNWATNSRVS
jgi:hypothetical protein